MNEQQLLWLLARIYCRQRLEIVSSHLAPLHDELATVLTNAAGFQISSTEATDSDILEVFRPRETTAQTGDATPLPNRSKAKKSKEEGE